MSNTNYINNDDIYEEILKYLDTCEFDENGKYIKGSGRMSEKLGEMVLLIATNLSRKGNFSGYTYKDDMVSEALYACVNGLHNFKPEFKDKAFNYVTQTCYRAFIAYINKQKKHSEIKDKCYKNQDKIDEYKLYISGINYEDLIK